MKCVSRTSIQWWAHNAFVKCVSRTSIQWWAHNAFVKCVSRTNIQWWAHNAFVKCVSRTSIQWWAHNAFVKCVSRTSVQWWAHNAFVKCVSRTSMQWWAHNAFVKCVSRTSIQWWAHNAFVKCVSRTSVQINDELIMPLWNVSPGSVKEGAHCKGNIPRLKKYDKHHSVPRKLSELVRYSIAHETTTTQLFPVRPLKVHKSSILLFHNYISSSGEQPKQCILAHKSEQPTAGCIAIFHKYCCYIKHGGIITNLNLWNPWGYVTDMSKYHSAGVRSMV